LREWRRTGFEPAAALALTVAAAGVMLAVFGKTQGEVARLWLFLVPCLCLVAARELVRRFGGSNAQALALLLLLQGGTVYLMKRFMDFA
jgi:predicted membrane channel-forming protein YqfA (hemolysin III family)